MTIISFEVPEFVVSIIVAGITFAYLLKSILGKEGILPSS